MRCQRCGWRRKQMMHSQRKTLRFRKGCLTYAFSTFFNSWPHNSSVGRQPGKYYCRRKIGRKKILRKTLNIDQVTERAYRMLGRLICEVVEDQVKWRQKQWTKLYDRMPTCNTGRRNWWWWWWWSCNFICIYFLKVMPYIVNFSVW